MKNKLEEIWIIKYNIAAAYYERNGNLEIPEKFKTLNGYEYDENGINLGRWLTNQKQSYKKATLSPERIHLLKDIGMCFEIRDNNNEWNKNYTLAKNYYEHNGNLEIPQKFKTLNGYEYDENGISLGTWLATQRQSYKKEKLSPERINLLKAIDMCFEPRYNDDWNEKYALVKNYYERNGNLEIPRKFKTLNGYEYDENGINLGIWIRNQRQSYKKARLSPERIHLLKNIGMCLETRDNNNEWNKNYALAKNYYERNGNLEIPGRFKTLNGYEYDENGINLGIWIISQRRSYKNVKLSPEKINLLKTIEMRFEIKYNDGWNKNYALAKNYYEHNGNLEIPEKFKTLNGYEHNENGINLGMWFHNQRQLYKKARISPERLNLLKDIGMCFETRDNNNEWNKNYTLAKNYYEHNGNLEIPEKFKTLNGYEHDENGINLGMWIISQRRSYKNVKLSPERLNLLKNIGMRFEIKHNNNEWNKNYALAKNYYERNGNLEIPEKFKTLNGYEYDENGINLRRWLAVQTQLYQKARLSTERINLLENIGIKWFAYNNINYIEQNVIFDNNNQRLIKLKILNSFKSYLNSLDQNTLPSKEEINQNFLCVLNYIHKKK